MYIEFVDEKTQDVLIGVEAETVPRVADRISLKDKDYRVYSVEWCIFEDRPESKRLSPIVYLIKDEIEAHKKEKK